MAACSLVCYRASVALAHEPALRVGIGDHGRQAAHFRARGCWRCARCCAIAGETIPVRRILLTFGPDYWCLFALVGVVGICIRRRFGVVFRAYRRRRFHGGAPVRVDCGSFPPLRLSHHDVAIRGGVQGMFAGNARGAFAHAFHRRCVRSYFGTIMIMCYDVCGMLFLFYIANASRETGVSSFALSGIYLIGSNAFLAFGLAAGLVVGAFSAKQRRLAAHTARIRCSVSARHCICVRYAPFGA